MSLPRVSILTPTRDRRAFLPELFRAVARQTYPADRLQLVVADDGYDHVADAVEALRAGLDPATEVVYAHTGQRLALGSKRNRLVEMSDGEILIHFDDDDAHPAHRVQRAVDLLLSSPDTAVVGCSQLVFWDLTTGHLHQQHAIGPKHATAGSMAFRRTWWDKHRFAAVPHTEEREFLDNFTAPLLPFDSPPHEVVVAIAHGGNTLPKNPSMPRLMLPLEEVVPDAETRAFFQALDLDDW